jgi:hypothetical protein
MSFHFCTSHPIRETISHTGDGTALANARPFLGVSDPIAPHGSLPEVIEIEINPASRGMFPWPESDKRLCVPPVGDKRKSLRECKSEECESGDNDEDNSTNEGGTDTKESRKSGLKKTKIERRQVSWVHKHFTLSNDGKKARAQQVPKTNVREFR